MTKRRKYNLLILLSLSLFVLAVGCTQKKEGSPSEEKVRKAVNIYTQAAIKNDFNTMYELLSPEDKATISKEEYLRRQQYQVQISPNVVLKSGKIKKVRVSKGEAVVEMELDTQAPHPIPTTKVLVYRNGSWYVVLSPQNKKELSIGKSFEEFQKEHPPQGQ